MKAMFVKLNFLFLIVLLAAGCNKSATNDLSDLEPRTGDYYVSPDGDDSNNGSDSLPWKSIQKAIVLSESGKVIVVKPGFYEEVVKITKGGLGEDKRLIIISETEQTAKCLGFIIQSDYVTIDGFDIEAGGTTNWTGVKISNADNVDIQNCYIHDCSTGGIWFAGSDNSKAINNKIDHNGLWGITMIGTNSLIEGNIISNVVQYHPKGQEPGLSGQDADGMRIFGSGHVIRSNELLDIGDPGDPANVDPHVDAIQTWDGSANGQPLMTNTIIEGNYIRVKHKTGKGIILDATQGNACHHLTIRNNIIEFNDIGIDAHSGIYNNIFVYNNIFKANLNYSSWGTSVHFVNVSNYAYVNNITVDCHPEHRKILEGSGVVDYNLAWNSDGSAPTMTPAKQANDIVGENPLFVKYTGTHGESDYHLLSGSPAINKGAILDQVTDDFDGVPRPQEGEFDIGAFEFK